MIFKNGRNVNNPNVDALSSPVIDWYRKVSVQDSPNRKRIFFLLNGAGEYRLGFFENVNSSLLISEIEILLSLNPIMQLLAITKNVK